MRATKNNAKGTSGQSYVKAQFEELGWGAIPNSEHDLGTDLFLMARDHRRFDLGTLVGVQVKNWDIGFGTPQVNKGVEGWWFSDTSGHFEYWLNHRIPHLVVFYDKTSKKSYWIHITRDAVVSTGKQRKIFVPKSQTIDTEHFDDLVKVAVSVQSGKTWEGSAWLPGQDIPEDSRIRYALLVPRLIAPHPNSSVEAVSAEQAIGLLTAMRTWELKGRYREKQPLIDMSSALASGDDIWCLYGAMYAWLENNKLEQLESFEGSSAHIRAAQAVILAAALFECGKIAESINILESALNNFDDYNMVDHAWLAVNLARNLVQLGRRKDALEYALQVAPIGQISESDPTAKLLSGVAAEMVFTLNGWQSSDIAMTIQSRDNAASWWRSQSMSYGLAKMLETDFKSWANDKSVTFGGADSTWSRLRSATLVSAFSGDLASWKYEAALLAQYVLMNNWSIEEQAQAISFLRFAGAKKEIQLITARLLDHGPLEVLKISLDEVKLEVPIKGSLACDLEFIGVAGVLYSEKEADQKVRWLLDELKHPESRVRELGLMFRYAEELVKTVARLYNYCSEDTKAIIRKFIVNQPVVEDQSFAHELANLIHRIHEDDWEDQDIKNFIGRNEGDNFELTNALQELIASRNKQFRSTLETKIENGDFQALISWGNVSDLSPEAATGMIILVAKAVRQEIESARRGAYSFGKIHPVEILTLLNIWHPDNSDWSACIEAFSEHKSHPNDIVPGLKVIAKNSFRVPEDVREQLREPLQSLYNSPPARKEFFALSSENNDARGIAAELLAILYPADFDDDEIYELLQGDIEMVVAAIRILGYKQEASSLKVFTALSKSNDLEVKAAVVYQLATWVARGIESAASFKILQQILSNSGIRLATNVTRAVAAQPASKGSDTILSFLENNESALMRHHVKIIRSKWENANKK